MRLLTILLLAGAGLAADRAMLPDPQLTPGATDPRVTQATIQATICKPGYTSTVRSVPRSEKREVMRRYGLPESDLRLVEVDHFLSLEIGGANDITNLWPQYYDAAPGQQGYLGARQKDVVETNLKRQVCAGKITLREAQQRIRAWPEAYKRAAK